MAVSSEERRIVTVLFADVAGSTALGEQLDPEEMRRLLARFYSIAREAVAQHGGTVEKFIGDAVMAVFGLPTAHGDDPDRAIAAAVAIRDRIRSDAQLGSRLAVRFGISTGEVVASRDQSAGDFLITGDATNVAARLQQSADPWAIVASERTVRAADTFHFGDVLQVEAKGKAAAVPARVVLGPRRRLRGHAHLPLVGRETDLAQLELVARRAVNEKRPSMASVIAPAGTGKTRLVEEFLDWLPNLTKDAIVATAQCLPYGQQLTYWPMRQVLFTLTGISEDAMPSELRPRIAEWLAGLGVEDADRDAKLLAATVGDMGAEGIDKDLLFAAWRSALEAAARRHPLVIVFEDLHWSSDSLLDLAEFVMQPRGEAAVLMMVLARPELLDRRPNWGGGRLNHLAIALEPLGATAIADLVRNLLDSDQPDLVELVAARSEGNPFYAGELVRSYMERGSLAMLPDTVQATVLARLDLLPAVERRVLQLGSVFGRAFRATGVGALEPGVGETVRRACENLADRDLLRPADGDRYSFRHILIQEVAYSTLPRVERARLHGEAARWLEAVSAGREVAVAEIIAFHYREAAVLGTALDPESATTTQARERAAKWLLKAADVASAAGATPEAVRHIRASLDFVEPAVAPHLHERMGDLTAGDAGIDEFRTALALYEARDAPADDRLRALTGILMVATRWRGSVGGRMSESEMDALRAKGRDLAAQAGDRRSVASFMAADAFYPFWIGGIRLPTTAELALAADETDRALKIATELDDAELISCILDAQGGLATTVFDWPGVLETTRRRLEIEDRLGFYERIDAYSSIAWMGTLMGELAATERDTALMASRVLPGQAPYPALHLFAWRTLILMLLGRWDEAVTSFYRCVDAWNDAGRHAAGYGLRGFVAGFDIGRARGDMRLMAAASDPILSIVARFDEDSPYRQLPSLISGEGGFGLGTRHLDVGIFGSDTLERRLCLAGDLRQEPPPGLLDLLLNRAAAEHLPVLEAQIRRLLGLAGRDPAQLRAAISLWERMGALPNLGRGRAELGALEGDGAETESGLAILRRVGDVTYVDRFTAMKPPVRAMN